jgi:hypothetical protein
MSPTPIKSFQKNKIKQDAQRQTNQTASGCFNHFPSLNSLALPSRLYHHHTTTTTTKKPKKKEDKI